MKSKLETAISWFRKPAIHEAGYVLIDQAMMSLAIFLAGILVARATSKEDYGVYVLGWSVASVVMSLHRAIVVLPFTVYSPRLAPEERDTYQTSGFIHTIIICAIALLAVGAWWIGSSMQANSNATQLRETLPLIGILLFPYLLREFMRSAALARLEYLASMLANVTASVLMVVLLLTSYFTHNLGVKSAYIYIASASLVAVIALTWHHRNRMSARISNLWLDFKRSMKIGKWLLINVLAHTIVLQIYPWLLLYFSGAAAVGAFGAAVAVAGVLGPFLRGINAYLLPRMTHSCNESTNAGLLLIMRRSIVILAIPYGSWTLLGGLFSDPIMTFLYSEQYSGYGLLLILLLIKTTIDSLSTPISSALQSLERPDVTSISLVIGATISLLFGIVLVKNFQLIGAGVTATIAAGSIALYKWYGLKRICRSSSA